MRSVVTVASVLLLTASITCAQFKKGDVELSFSGSLGSWSNEFSDSYSGGISHTYSDSHNYLFVAISPGYYLEDGLSVEPELSLMAAEKSKPIQYLLLNLSYTYLLPNSVIAPYAIAGYGLSNSVQMAGMTVYPLLASNKFNVGVFNAGAGVKFLLNRFVVLRTEINYKSHAWSETQDYGYGMTDKTETNLSFFGLQLGISVLL
jgi:hypothetical protein